MIWEIATSLFGGIGSYVIAAFGFVAAIVAARWSGKQVGRKESENEFLKDKSERERAARDKLREGRDSGLSPADRVRRNDGDWRGL